MLIAVLGVWGLAVTALWVIALFNVRLKYLTNALSTLCVLQVQAPVLVAPPAVVVAGLAAPGVASRAGRLFRHAAVISLVVMVLAQATALVWSPDVPRGLRETALTFVFLVQVCACWLTRAEGRDPVSQCARVVWPIVLAELLSVWIFRFFPSVERTYLNSEVAYVLLGNAAARVFTTEPNNVVFTFKSGGLFFVNANVASLFLGCVTLLFACEASSRTGHKSFRVFAFLCFTTIFATGSKTGLALAVLVPVLVVLLLRLFDKRFRTTEFFLGLGLLPIVVWLTIELLQQVASRQVDVASGRIDDPAKMLEARMQIWSPVEPLFVKSPVLGLGFGGWQEEFTKYVHLGTQGGAYPPHNLLIAAWANAGMANLAAALIFILVVLTAGCRMLLNVEDPATRRRTALALGAMVWVVVHGQADNTYLYGCMASIPVVAALLSQILWAPEEDWGDAADGAGAPEVFPPVGPPPPTYDLARRRAGVPSG